jgi:hypothetical protein
MYRKNRFKPGTDDDVGPYLMQLTNTGMPHLELPLQILYNCSSTVSERRRLLMNVDKVYFSTQKFLEMLAGFVGTNTFFIALNDGVTNRVVQVLNKKETLMENGMEISLQDAY